MTSQGINPFQEWVNSLIQAQVQQGKQTIINQLLEPFVKNPWLIAVIVFFLVMFLYFMMDKVVGGMVKWKKGTRKRR